MGDIDVALHCFKEERREKAREAAERRQMANQSRGVGHNPRLEAKQKRLEKEEKKAILSGRANQPGNLSVRTLFYHAISEEYVMALVF